MEKIVIINQSGKAGKKGLWKEYSEQSYSKGRYVRGKKNGYWKVFWLNGNIRSHGHFENGSMRGLWKIYNEKGEMLFEYLLIR